MKKILAFIFILISGNSFAQIPISQLPLYTGSSNGTIVPIVIGGVTRKMDGSKLGQVSDSTKIPYLASTNVFTGLNTFPSVVLATNGSDTLATKSYARSLVVKPYKVVSGYISSSDTSTFSLTVLQNDFIGTTYTLTKNSVGILNLHFSNNVLNAPLYKNVLVGASYGRYTITTFIPYLVSGEAVDAYDFQINFFNTSGYMITPIFNTTYFFEVRVYP